MPEPTIFAMGGGGFTMEPGNRALDDYALALSPAPVPRICLLPTASGDGEAQIRQFHATFGVRLCEPAHVSLFRLGRNPVPLRERLLAQDVIYVGGGSMVGLLAVWRALGLDRVLRECWERGVVLADGEPARLPVYRRAVRGGRIPPGWAADDGAGLLFRGGTLVDVVTSRPGARVRRGDPAGDSTIVPRRLRREPRAHTPDDVAEFRRVARRRRSA